MIPNLPTDNLYKFSFVGCLFLIGLTAYLTGRYQSDLLASYDKYKLESIALDYQYEELLEEYQMIDEKVAIDSTLLNGKEVLDFRKKRNLFKRTQANLNARIDIAQEKLDYFACKILPSASLFAFILFLLAIYSCYLWYIRLQYYQDEILKSELTKP
ncbi:hypothetical protein [Sphingobacterium chungjuense]|uniref:hypothetical protein n=1 Tax=Sphingobacterium chungjuense TaxID=2675553 RepID=UPI00140B3003|nr:hypothetical protein [Sphingobacterium chungjuense]